MRHTWFPTYPLLNSGSFPVFPVSINGTNIHQEPQVENQSIILAFSLFLRPASFPLASPANLISNSLPTQILPSMSKTSTLPGATGVSCGGCHNTLYFCFHSFLRRVNFLDDSQGNVSKTFKDFSEKKKKIKPHPLQPALGDLSLYADFISYHSPNCTSCPSDAGLHGVPLTCHDPSHNCQMTFPLLHSDHF